MFFGIIDLIPGREIGRGGRFFFASWHAYSMQKIRTAAEKGSQTVKYKQSIVRAVAGVGAV